MRQLRKENGEFATISDMFTPTERYSMYTVMTLWAIWGIMFFGLHLTNASLQGYAFAKEVWAEYTDSEYEKILVLEKKDPVKVLEVVASCESGETAGVTPGRQFDKNGVLIIGRASKDGSLDVGKHQINRERHERKARALGMDIYTEHGNTDYARHLYDAEGLTPWNPSRDCWNNKI